MEADLGSLPDAINPNNFPAKLWRLVNNPTNKAICWDHRGELVIIDQKLVEREVLSPSTSDSPEAFKTNNFSSFVRQLNLYGFKKADAQPDLDMKAFHCFYNPDFKRDHPELVGRLRRLTVDNKAKIQAGLSVNCRTPSRFQLVGSNGGERDKHVRRVSRGDSLLLSPTNHEAVNRYYPHKSQAMKSYSGTPVPPRYLIGGHPYTGVSSASNAVHFQQSLLAHTNRGSPNFTGYSPDYFSPVCHYYHPNLVAPHMAGSSFQAGLFSPQSYYQAGCPVNVSFLGENNQGSQKNENQEAKNCEVNLEAVFQIAEEVMQTPPNTCLVKVEAQEELVPALESSANTGDASLCDSGGGGDTVRSNPVSSGYTIVAVSSSDAVVAYKEQQECVVSVPEQMPEDVIVEVKTNPERDTEMAAGDSARESRQES